MEGRMAARHANANRVDTLARSDARVLTSRAFTSQTAEKRMRISVRLAIILVVFSGSALAKGKKGAANAKGGASTMDTNDPAEKETSDEGPFAPRHKSEEAEAKDKEKAEVQATEHEEAAVKRRPRDKM